LRPAQAFCSSQARLKGLVLWTCGVPSLNFEDECAVYYAREQIVPELPGSQSLFTHLFPFR
jgi:hypothetical protein